VLRMKQGDPEATEGLERAKSNMLKSLDPTERKSRPPPPVAPKEDDGEGTAPPPIPPAARLPDVSIAADISPAKEADLDLPPVRDPDKTPPGDIDQLLAETAAEDATQAGASIPTPPPPVAVETPPAPNSDIAIDVDMSADTSGEHAEMSGEHTVVDEDDIVMADEVEVVEESAPAVKTEPPPKPKRSMPPPLPPRS